jgi:hypothetical protein
MSSTAFGAPARQSSSIKEVHMSAMTVFQNHLRAGFETKVLFVGKRIFLYQNTCGKIIKICLECAVGDIDDIYTYLEGIKPFAQHRDWNGLENHFRELATELAGKTQAGRIAKLGFAKFERQLDPAFAEAVAQAEEAQAMAIYYEYDLDNRWGSIFCICQEYLPEAANDEDWACDWVGEVEGPYFDTASDLYRENGFDRTSKAMGSTLYLVARTVAAYGRCFDRHYSPGPAVCIAFHDQEPILRLAEPISGRKPKPTPPKKTRPRQEIDEVAEYVLRYYKHLMSPEEQEAARGVNVPENMPDQYLQAIVDRLIRDRTSEVIINRCPKCNHLCRSPEARQCPSCIHQW